jgi:hypothetical protein
MTPTPLRFIALLESSALVFGVVLSLAAWWWTSRLEVALASLLGSLFSSGNFRLLIWNWSPMLDADQKESTAEAPQSQSSDTQAQSADTQAQNADTQAQSADTQTQDSEPPTQNSESLDSAPLQRSLFLTARFLFKHLFLLGGLILCLWGLQLHVAGFSLGLGNIVIAILLSPLLPQSTE